MTTTALAHLPVDVRRRTLSELRRHLATGEIANPPMPLTERMAGDLAYDTWRAAAPAAIFGQ